MSQNKKYLVTTHKHMLLGKVDTGTYQSKGSWVQNIKWGPKDN